MSKRYSRSEILFLTAYSLWLIFEVLNLTYFRQMMPLSDIRQGVRKLVYLLLILKLYDDNELDAGTLAGLAVIAVTYLICRRAEITDLFVSVCFIVSMRNVDYRKVFRVTIILQLLIMAATVTTSISGLLPNELWTGPDMRERYDWGYTYCTYGSHIAMFLSLLYMSLKKTLKLWQALLLFGFNYLWARGTMTNTDLYLFIFSIAGTYLLGRMQLAFDNKRIEKLCFFLIGIIVPATALTAQVIYDGSEALWLKANLFFNGRLKLGHDGLDEYGIPLLGRKIRWVGAGSKKKHPDWIYNYVDCSYLKYAIHYGIIFEVILLVGIVLLGIWVAGNTNPGLKIAYISWLIFGMIDAELLVLSFQPIMLLLGYVFAARQNAPELRMENMPVVKCGG